MSEIIDVAQRWRCTECEWIGGKDAIIRFDDPDEEGNFWNICPQCRQAEQFELLCWKCDAPSSCGMPTTGYGYIHTCHKHSPASDSGGER